MGISGDDGGSCDDGDGSNTLVAAGVIVVVMGAVRLSGSLWSVPHGTVHQAALSHE